MWMVVTDISFIALVTFSSFLVSLAVSEKSVRYVFVNQSVTWDTARQYCQLVEKGHLADFTSTPPVNHNNIWIGRYSTYSNWTWSTGCYQNSVLQNTELINLVDNSVVSCQNMCNTTFVALRGTGCHCLAEKPTDDDGSDDCSILCAGDSSDLCGSQSSASVYEKHTNILQIGKIQSDGDQPCGTYEPSTKQLIQRDCSSNCQYVCRYFSDGEFIDGIGTSYYSWNTASQICRNGKGTLGDATSADRFSSFVTGSIWVGLFRKSRNFTIEEMEPGSSPILSCFQYKNGAISVLDGTNCNNDQLANMPFICQVESESEIDTTVPTSPRTSYEAESQTQSPGEQYTTISSVNYTVCNSTTLTQNVTVNLYATANASLEIGTVAGAVIGVLLVIGIIVLVYFCRIRPGKQARGSREQLHRNDNIASDTTPVEKGNGNGATIPEYSVVSKTKLNEPENAPADKSFHEEEIYAETEEGEYDVLGQSRLKKSKSQTNIYDCTDSNTYDHTNGMTEKYTGYGNTYDTSEAIKVDNLQNEHLYDHTDTSNYNKAQTVMKYDTKYNDREEYTKLTAL